MKYVWRTLGILLPLLMIAGLAWAYIDRQSLYDWYQLRNYNPPAEIAKLATDDTFTSKARHDFYVNHPELITNKFKFQQECTQTEQTIVLGCYHGNQGGIAIYNVNDSRLNGVAQVTAAHEMLHSAYDRLSKGDKNKINGWLTDFYKTVKDKRIIKTINSYKKTEPDDVVNEMHSIFGTEIGSLPKQLETYYKQYFTNRSKIVAFSNSYEAAFETRQKQIDDMAARLSALADRVNALNKQLTAQKKSLDRDRNSRAVKTDQAANSAFNTRVREYNNGVTNLNNLVEQYNTLRNQYGKLVLQEQELFNAINTKSLRAESAQ